MTKEPADHRITRPPERPAGDGRRDGIRVLVTAFGPFPGVPDNPSAEILRRLPPVAGVRLVRRQLATEWAMLDEIGPFLAEIRPRLAVHVGVAPRERRLRIETVAFAACDAAADAAGRLPPSVPAAAAAHRRVCAGAAPLVAVARRAGVPAAASGDAGRYLCNALLYRSLTLAAAATRPHTAVFIHVPPPAPARGRRLEDLVAAVAAVVRELARRSRPPQPKSRSRAV